MGQTWAKIGANTSKLAARSVFFLRGVTFALFFLWRITKNSETRMP